MQGHSVKNIQREGQNVGHVAVKAGRDVKAVHEWRVIRTELGL